MKQLIVTLLVIFASVSNIFGKVESIPYKSVDYQLSCYAVWEKQPSRPVRRAPMIMPIIHISENIITLPENLIDYEMQIISVDGTFVYEGAIVNVDSGSILNN